jgi:signal transduction histidine kinase
MEDLPQRLIPWIGEIRQAAADSKALCIALFSTGDRKLVRANAAAVHLLRGGGPERLVNPTFDKLLECRGNEPAYEGLLTLGDNESMNTTIQAKVFVRDGEMLITGEVDLPRITDLNTKMARINQENNNLQRQLLKEKIQVERMMEELRETNRQLGLLNLEKNRFLSMAAHDLRNPISTAISYVDILLNSGGLFPEDKRTGFLHTIDERLKFSLKLMNELLDVSRIETRSIRLEVREHSYRDLLEQTIRFNQLVGRWKEISVGLACPGDPLVFAFDRNKMEQVLNNLISNAIKYSPKGSKVRIQVDREKEAVHTAVCDQGVGIREDELEGIFEPFRKSSSRPTAGESSTGLGLAITKKIIEEHGGGITVESSPGKGSCFRFTLPVSRPPSG